MESLNELRKVADDLIRAKNFTDVPFYMEKIWTNYKEQINEWDVWRYAISLKNLKRYEEALRICQKYAKIFPDNESINNVHAWCIFYLKIRKKENPDFIKDALQIKKLASVNKQYTAYVPTAYAVLKVITEDIHFPAKDVLEWTSDLGFDQLSEQVYTFKQKGKNIEIASQKEYFMVWHAKALFFNEQYPACIDFVNSVLGKLQKFHYSNDVWLKRLIAMSYQRLEKYNEAVDIYRNLLTVKNEWFMHKEIAELFFELNQLDLAFKHSIISVDNNVPLEKKISAIYLLANILDAQDMYELAMKHYLLVYLIRKKNNWIIDKELLNLLKDNKMLENNHDLNYIKKLLADYWISQNSSTYEVFTGVIQNMLSHGNAGFIKSDNKSYYFKISDYKSDVKDLRVNQKVSFGLQEGFDKKKQTKTLNAINVKILI